MPTLQSKPNTNHTVHHLRQQIVQLEQQLDALTETDTAKRDFLAHIAHELRTPLNTIIGFAQILDRHTDISDEQREYLALILMSSDHLMSLISDILQISKLEAGEVSLNPVEFDLYELIEELKSIYRAKAGDKELLFNIQISSDIQRYICADKTKVRQIIDNLLSNAFKFTHEGSITLKITSNSNQLNITVADTGQGIKEDELVKLFEPYQQTTTGETSNKGTGLGVAITQKLVQMMNGTLKVESQWGYGTIFTACIRVAPSTQKHTTEDNASQVSSLDLSEQNYRILVVDDSTENRRLLIQILTSTGFEVQSVTNGKEAIDRYHTWQPDLILMDMRMPIMNGYDATRKIRALDTEDTVTIIALTANAFDHEIGATQLAGCDGYVVKPFQIATLLETIGKHLEIPITYDERAKSSEDDMLLNQELQALPSATLKRLVSVASSYSIEQVQALIPQLPPTVSAYVEARLDEFDFDSIIALVSIEAV